LFFSFEVKIFNCITLSINNFKVIFSQFKNFEKFIRLIFKALKAIQELNFMSSLWLIVSQCIRDGLGEVGGVGGGRRGRRGRGTARAQCFYSLSCH